MIPTRVLVLGDVMRDVVVQLAGPMRRGTDQRAGITLMPGGSAANLAAWLAQGGVPVRLLAAVGRVDLAAETDRLSRLGVEPALVASDELPTGTLVAVVDPDGERSFLTDRGANDRLATADLPAGILDDVGQLHVSGYAFVGVETRATARRLIAEARARDIAVSLDPGSAGFIADLGAAAFLAWSQGAGLCAVNAAEAAVLTGQADVDAQLSWLAARFELVLLKQGPLGATARHADGRHWQVPAPQVAVRDTIGAGDAFLAGYLAARWSGSPIETCLAAAVRQGSLAATLRGGLPPVS